MKFKVLKESTSNYITEGSDDFMFLNPDDARNNYVKDEVDRVYDPIRKMIKDGKYEEALNELTEREQELDELEETNKKKRFFKYPKFMINNERLRIDKLKAQIPTAKNESVEDMDRRCEECNTLLNDAGTCPKCSDGEEDYDNEIKEELSNKEKLERAYPGVFNFSDNIITEEKSIKDRLKAKYPELNFNESPSADTTVINEETEAPVSKHVRKYGAWWWGIVDEHGQLTRDESNKLLLFDSKVAAENYLNGATSKMDSFKAALSEFLDKNDMHETPYISEENELQFDIVNGDWKHEHARIDYLVHKFFDLNNDKYEIVDEWTDVTHSEGSDCYSALHTYKFIEK